MGGIWGRPLRSPAHTQLQACCPLGQESPLQPVGYRNHQASVAMGRGPLQEQRVLPSPRKVS